MLRTQGEGIVLLQFYMLWMPFNSVGLHAFLMPSVMFCIFKMIGSSKGPFIQ